MDRKKKNLPEIWGGIECSISRVNNDYMDQLKLSGLYTHPEYLDAAISLGVKKMRFPILWESHQPVLSCPINWGWTQSCLQKLRADDIVPIAGLLHHGSGPAFTALLDERFPELFAQYAAKVAAKFPWLEYYTPINEPLTTARFSGLYGLWYPHKKNDACFIKILLHELKATVLAMQQIRQVNPGAKLVQTEDLGKTYSTPLLSYQADFENNRRWLTYDILCGIFDESHPLWSHIIRLGINPGLLHFFLENPCAPDIIGVNHYITSERYLDENIETFPIGWVGGNGIHRYADIEAVRTRISEPHGLAPLLKEVWQRYHIPIAITEAHLNCTREDQLRWLNHVIDHVVTAKKEGVEILAVTSWALLGSFGWDKLLTAQSCNYETGAFDISAGYPRPTALALLIKRFIKKEIFAKQLLELPGWWEQDARFHKKEREQTVVRNANSVQPVVFIGNHGALARAFSAISQHRNIHHFLLGKAEAGIGNESMLSSMIRRYHPWAIVNLSEYPEIDQAEENKKTCYKENYLDPWTLAIRCAEYGIKLLSFSSDQVFDGNKLVPYVENDLPRPLNTFGRSKQLAESYILSDCPRALIIRTAALFGVHDKQGFVYESLRHLAEGNKVYAQDEIIVSPTYIPHLVNACLDLLIDDASGIWHITNSGCVSWYEFAKKIVGRTNFDAALVTPATKVNTLATRPVFSALGSIRYNLMPSLDEALDRFFSIEQSVRTLTNQNITDERV